MIAVVLATLTVVAVEVTLSSSALDSSFASARATRPNSIVTGASTRSVPRAKT